MGSDSLRREIEADAKEAVQDFQAKLAVAINWPLISPFRCVALPL